MTGFVNSFFREVQMNTLTKRTTQMPRLLTHVVIAVERWKLRSCDAWMKACERDGIACTRSMAVWRMQAQAHRARIAMLETTL